MTQRRGTDGPSTAARDPADALGPNAVLGVSRFHCEIGVESAGARVRDLGSKVGAVTLRFDFVGHVSRLAISSRTSFHGVVASSPAMRIALAVIERAAAGAQLRVTPSWTSAGPCVAAAHF
jgi:hypothetical protein